MLAKHVSRIVVVAAAVLFSATGAHAASITDVEYVGFSAENAEAGAGLTSILRGDDFNYGLPLVLFDRVMRDGGLNDPDKRWRVLGSVPSPPWRVTPHVEIPLSDSLFERDGVRVVNVNCFSCHSGVVAGRVVAGLGSSHIDGGSFAASGHKLVEQWDNPIQRAKLALLLGGPAFRILRGFVEHQRTIVLPSLQARARGENHGPWVVWRHIARMIDPSKGMDVYGPSTRSPLEGLLDRELPPVDPSPWWNLKHKDRAFWTRDVNLHSLATFALNLMDPAPRGRNTRTFRERMERMRLQLAFARQTEAPAMPWRDAVDRDLAERGHGLFKATCAGCHGDHDADGRLVGEPYHGRVPLNVIGTDPAYATILHGSLKPLYDRFARSPFIQIGSADAVYPDTAGYEPPPLVGIWASAPYFHNGSVPTVAAVLDSGARPTAWRRSLDPFEYDRDRLGLAYEDVTRGELARLDAAADASGDEMSEAALARRQVFDTEIYGRGNQGHAFGDRLSAEERRAVVEFLKLF